MTTWNIDTSHSGAHFSVRHMVISKVRGAFERFTGVIELDEANPAASKVSVSIDATSINTHEPKRDAHLRSADFFDVEKYPELTFVSTKVEKVGDAEYRVTGAAYLGDRASCVKGPLWEVRGERMYDGDGAYMH